MTFIVIPQRERAIYRFGSTSWLNMRKRNYQMLRYERLGMIPRSRARPVMSAASEAPVTVQRAVYPPLPPKYRRSPLLNLPLPPQINTVAMGAPGLVSYRRRPGSIDTDVSSVTYDDIRRNLFAGSHSGLEEEGVAVEVRTSAGLGEGVYDISMEGSGLRRRVSPDRDTYMTEGVRRTRERESPRSFVDMGSPDITIIERRKSRRSDKEKLL